MARGAAPGWWSVALSEAWFRRIGRGTEPRSALCGPLSPKSSFSHTIREEEGFLKRKWAKMMALRRRTSAAALGLQSNSMIFGWSAA